MGLIALIISLLLGVFTLAPASGVETTDMAAPVEVTVEAVVPTEVATAEPTVVAVAQPPYLTEIYNLLDYGRGIFLPALWEAKAWEEDTRTLLVYRSKSDTSLVDIEYMHYPGMPNNFSVPDYIKDDYFDIIFRDYEGWKKLDQCTFDGLYLYEFTVDHQGFDYHVRYWASVAAPSRILTVSAIFEPNDMSDLNRYAQMLFPTLPSCASRK